MNPCVQGLCMMRKRKHGINTLWIKRIARLRLWISQVKLWRKLTQRWQHAHAFLLVRMNLWIKLLLSRHQTILRVCLLWGIIDFWMHSPWLALWKMLLSCTVTLTLKMCHIRLIRVLILNRLKRILPMRLAAKRRQETERISTKCLRRQNLFTTELREEKDWMMQDAKWRIRTLERLQLVLIAL